MLGTLTGMDQEHHQHLSTAQNGLDFSRYWDQKEVARYLHVSVEFLEQDRRKARRIPYSKIGRRVRYDPADVKAYAESCKVRAPGFASA